MAEFSSGRNPTAAGTKKKKKKKKKGNTKGKIYLGEPKEVKAYDLYNISKNNPNDSFQLL